MSVRDQKEYQVMLANLKPEDIHFYGVITNCSYSLKYNKECGFDPTDRQLSAESFATVQAAQFYRDCSHDAYISVIGQFQETKDPNETVILMQTNYRNPKAISKPVSKDFDVFPKTLSAFIHQEKQFVDSILYQDKIKAVQNDEEAYFSIYKAKNGYRSKYY